MVRVKSTSEASIPLGHLQAVNLCHSFAYDHAARRLSRTFYTISRSHLATCRKARDGPLLSRIDMTVHWLLETLSIESLHSAWLIIA